MQHCLRLEEFLDVSATGNGVSGYFCDLHFGYYPELVTYFQQSQYSERSIQSSTLVDEFSISGQLKSGFGMRTQSAATLHFGGVGKICGNRPYILVLRLEPRQKFLFCGDVPHSRPQPSLYIARPE